MQEKLSEDDLNYVFEIPETVEWIKTNEFKKVALQFPDDLASHILPVSRQLKQRVPDLCCYILADIVYGSCCVDEITAQHIECEAIIHYGHSCLSSTMGRHPVLYIFTRQPVDLDQLCSGFAANFPDPDSTIVAVFNTSYTHAIEPFRERLSGTYPHLVVVPNSAGEHPKRDLPSDDSISEEYSVWYVGPEGLDLTQVALKLKGWSTLLSWDPAHNSNSSASSHQLTTSRLLKRRFYLMSQVAQASRVGILVGTLAVSHYRDMISHIQTLSERVGKTTYVVYVGRPNPSKLANFADLDLFVLIACPQNSLLDCKEYLRPIVSPYEYELALNPADRSWLGGGYILEFDRLLEGGDQHAPLPEVPTEDEQQTHQDGTLQTYGTRTVSAINGKDGARSWWGLEPRLGQDSPATVQQGSSGLAWEYQNEPAC